MTDANLDLRETTAAAVAARIGAEPRSPRTTVIRPIEHAPLLDLRELWHYRELLFIFVWRDLKVRYKQTAVGVGWVLLQPLMTMLIFTFFLGRYAKAPTNGLPYPIFIMSGLLPMILFSSAVSQSSASIVSSSSLVTKVYFPRVLLPLAAAAVPLVDLMLSFSLLIGLMFYYSMFPSGALIALAPLFLILALVGALGIGLFLSALYVRYRDVPFAIPFFLQLLPWVSGVYLSLNKLPQHWQWIFALNPMSGVVMAWRWVMLGQTAPDLGKFALGCAVAVVLFVFGLVFFKRSEPRFADTI